MTIQHVGRKAPERAPDWAALRYASDDQLRKLLATHGFKSAEFTELSEFAHNLVDDAKKYRSALERRSARNSRKDVAALLGHLGAALKLTGRLHARGPKNPAFRLLPPAHETLSASAVANLVSVVTPWFLARLFGEPDRVALHSSGTFFDRDTTAWLRGLIRARPGEVMSAMLTELTTVFAEWEQALARVDRSGRRSYTLGRFLLRNLAEAYSRRLGKEPAATKKGPFSRFACDVIEAVGLPSNWVDNQLSRAIKEWREHFTTSQGKKLAPK